MTFRFLVVLICLCGAATVRLGAQPSPAAPVHLTLADAIARAQQTSHRLAEARAREGGARATVRVRQADRLPTLGLSGGYSRINHIDEFGVPQPDGSVRVIYPDLPNTARTRIFAEWPIYTGGRTEALERAAEAEARAAGADLDTARADLRLEVVRAYWALATAAEAARVLEEALERADTHVADVQSRLDAGLVPPNEVLSSEAQRSHQQVQLIEARNVHAAAAVDLRRLTGLDPDTPIDLVDRLEAVPGPVPGTTPPVPGTVDVSATVAEALRLRPERVALAARIEGAAERQSAAGAGRLPTISLAGGVDYARPNTRIFPVTDEWRRSWDAGVHVSWTLWDFGRTSAEIAEAGFATDALRERLAELDTTVDAEVRQRLLDLDSSRAAVRAASDGVRSAAEARRVVAERFEVGVATNTEVLDAQLALLEAELDRTRALANVRLAEARLERAIGR